MAWRRINSPSDKLAHVTNFASNDRPKEWTKAAQPDCGDSEPMSNFCQSTCKLVGHVLREN